MSTSDMITFHCPSCGMKLQVPAQMAGVTGPCPKCSANISAPQPDHTAANVVTPPQAAAPAPQQTPHPPVQQPQKAQQAQPSTQPSPQPQPQPVQRKPVESDKDTQTRQKQDNQDHQDQKQTLQTPAHATETKPRARWMRVIFPLAFLIVAGALVVAVLHTVGIFNLWNYNQDQNELFSKKPASNGGKTSSSPTEDDAPPPPSTDDPDPDHSRSSNTNPDHTSNGKAETPVIPLIEDKPEEGEFPELQLPPSSPDNKTVSAGTNDTNHDKPAPTPPRPVTPISPPPATPPATPTTPAQGQHAPSPPKAGFLANQNLNLFLEAKTLDERMGLMSKSKYSREQLMASCLAGPLKPIKSIKMVEMVPQAENNMTQYLYFVSFEDPKEDHQRHRIVMQVVERPGIHPPRVHGDAFIEHYEKKFAKYAKHPNKDVTTFHCIAEARTADLSKDLPKELKKTMVRLVIKSHPRGAAAFDAYLNKNSPLMEHIGTRKDFPYTHPRFCVLSFRWNTKDPNHPYIELNDIVHQGWEK